LDKIIACDLVKEFLLFWHQLYRYISVFTFSDFIHLSCRIAKSVTEARSSKHLIVQKKFTYWVTLKEINFGYTSTPLRQNGRTNLGYPEIINMNEQTINWTKLTSRTLSSFKNGLEIYSYRIFFFFFHDTLKRNRLPLQAILSMILVQGC